MTKEDRHRILALRSQIERFFHPRDWEELGFLLGISDIIDGNSRLLQSWNFSDTDYSRNILEVLQSVYNRDSELIDGIADYLTQRYSEPEVSEFISTSHIDSPPKRIITFSPQVFSVPDKPQNSRLVSVMLPFSLQKTYAAIKETCDQMELECQKGDDIWENSTFIQDIFDLIYTSQVVIADFTEKNPNVFYEVGIAHALGKTVIPITQDINDVPSDLRHHRTLKYLPNDEGFSEMKTELASRLRTTVPIAAHM